MLYHTHTIPNKDTLFMRHCIDMAWLAQTLTLPNPPVSAILLDESYEIIAQAIHLKAGSAHAEVLALLRGYEILSGKKSGLDKWSESKAIHDFLRENHSGLFRDKILLITLEPCNHYGKTPPCAELIAELKPAKVIIGFKDKWGKSSNGAKTLQKAGVCVEFVQEKILQKKSLWENPLGSAVLEGFGDLGDLENLRDLGDLEGYSSAKDFSHLPNLAHLPQLNAQMLDLLYPFLCLKENGYFNLFKLALRINGEYKDGQISGVASRRFTHNQRCIAQNLVISGRTARADKPRLDTRYADSFYALDSGLCECKCDSNPHHSHFASLPNPSQRLPKLPPKLPNVEILTRDKQSLEKQANLIPLFSLPNRSVHIKTSPNELSLNSGFNVIEGGFALLESLLANPSTKIDMLLLHISPSLHFCTDNAAPHQNPQNANFLQDLQDLPLADNAKNSQNPQNPLAKILQNFRILHTTILDDFLDVQNEAIKNELFAQDFATKADKSATQNPKTSKMDSSDLPKQTQTKSQDLLLWLKPTIHKPHA